MRHRLSRTILTCLSVFGLLHCSAVQASDAPLTADADQVAVCPLLHAKQLPSGLTVPAMTFTGPAGDGRRGSAGFTVQAQNLIDGTGTGWNFTFQRTASGYGFQVIHPLRKGHVVATVGSDVTVHHGGLWQDIGWGNPATGDSVQLSRAAEKLFPLKPDVPHTVVSQLSPTGIYRLWINDVLVCCHTVETAKPLQLETSPTDRFRGGSVWDRTTFSGPGFESRLKPGDGGLILGPMDGSGPQQFFKHVVLTAAPDDPHDEYLNPLLTQIDEMRRSGRVRRSFSVGGTGGGSFEIVPEDTSVLIGFHYTASRHYAGHLTIKAVQPIFRGRFGETTGEWCGVPRGKVHRAAAESGYAVSGIVAKYGNRVDGMRLIYMRVQDGRLNPDDTYRSDWIGGRRGSPEVLCAADGHPVIGIYGTKGADLDALGFIQAGTSFGRLSKQSLQMLMPQLTGRWVVSYTNGTQHTREIHADQRVNESDEIVRQGDDILIVFPDVIERITLSGDRLFVEHFNPASDYPNGVPAVMGTALRAE